MVLSLVPMAVGIADKPRPSDEETRRQLLDRHQADLNEARRLRARGELAGALAAGRRVLAADRRLFADDPPALADTLLWLAEVHAEAGQSEQARSACREAIQTLQAAPDREPWRLADARQALDHLDRIARLSPAEKKELDAARRRVRAVERSLQATGPGRAPQSPPATADTLQALQTAADTQKRLLGPTDPSYAATLDLLATACEAAHRYDDARRHRRALLALWEQRSDKRHPGYLQAMNKLTLLLVAAGHYDEAEPLLRQAVALSADLFGDEHPEHLVALNNLASLLHAQGHYASAEPIFRKLVELQARHRDDRPAEYATALNNLAGLYQSVGDAARALPLLRQSAEIRKQALGPDHPDTIAALNNLAGLSFEQGDEDRAERLFRDVLRVRQETLGPDHPDTAVSLNNLAAVCEARGRLEEAETLYRRALDIRRRVLGERHPATADSLGNLAAVLRARGHFDAAEPLYREALKIRQAALGPNHPLVATALNNLAAGYRSEGRPDKAAPLYRRALDIFHRLIEETFTVLSERRQLAMTRRLRRTLDGYLSVTAGRSALDEAAYGDVLRWKGMVFARQRALRQAATRPESAPLLADLRRVSAQLAAMAYSNPQASRPESWRATLAELSQRKERLESRLAEQVGPTLADHPTVGPADLGRQLPSGTVLIDFLEYLHHDTATPRPEHARPAETRLAAFVVGKGLPVVRLDLGPTEPIREAVETWRRSYGAPGKGARAGAELRRRIWIPLAAHLNGATTVLVSPDGDLARIPLAALPGDRPGTYLIEDYAIAVVPVPRMLPELLATAAPGESGDTGAESAGGLLLVGDVDYDAPPATEDDAAAGKSPPPVRSDGFHFAPLPSSRGEMLSVRDSFELAFEAGRLTTLRRGRATETAFRREAPKCRFLHIATHGFFAPPQVASVLAPNEQARRGLVPWEAAGGPGTLSALHPGLLSGLALAGANAPLPGSPDDGILTAEEVATLDLGTVDLAVLSACETGLGAVAGGEGLLGLQRAFQVAGTRSVVASLWKVSDEATRRLMEEFYTNLWEKKLGKVESLRQAQLALLHGPAQRGMAVVGRSPREQPKVQPPFYWAAFGLSGDWR